MGLPAADGGLLRRLRRCVRGFFTGWGDNPAKRFFAWLGRYTLEIYSIHYHFARLLNPGVLTFAVYSPRWFLFVGESFS